MSALLGGNPPCPYSSNLLGYGVYTLFFMLGLIGCAVCISMSAHPALCMHVHHNMPFRTFGTMLTAHCAHECVVCVCVCECVCVYGLHSLMYKYGSLCFATLGVLTSNTKVYIYFTVYMKGSPISQLAHDGKKPPTYLVGKTV